MANVHDDPGIGRRVSAARRRLGWSREALAFHAGISWSAIRQLEAGRRRNLRPGTLAGLARALGVTVGYLVSGDVVSVQMLEHRVLVYETDAEFVHAGAQFLSEAVQRSEAALAVTTSAHCDALRDRLGDETSGVEFADQSSWCDTPGGALSRTRAFVRGHLEAGVPWIRILVEPQLAGQSNGGIRLWAKYESLFNLVFQMAPLTTLCAYDAALDADVLEQMLDTHPATHSATGETTANDAYLDPAEYVLTPDVDPARPTA